jgi:uncharacterized membrane protein YfcA
MVLVLCILMSAYFIRGITGFGSALISVPLLALSQPLQFAIPLVLALDFTASLVLGSANTKKANWSEIKILLPAGMIGACIGAFALLRLPTEPVLVALGAFTMFFGFRNIFGLQPAGSLSRVWAIPAGLAGGGAGALFGAGSPPYIIYLTRRLLDKSEVRATFSWLIAIDGGFRLGLFLMAGLLFEPKLQLAYVLGLIPMAIGLLHGQQGAYGHHERGHAEGGRHAARAERPVAVPEGGDLGVAAIDHRLGGDRHDAKNDHQVSHAPGRGWRLHSRGAGAQQAHSFYVLHQRTVSLTAQYWNPILTYVGRKSGVPLELKLAKTAQEGNANAEAGAYAFLYTNHFFTPERDRLGYKVIARRRPRHPLADRGAGRLAHPVAAGPARQGGRVRVARRLHRLLAAVGRAPQGRRWTSRSCSPATRRLPRRSSGSTRSPPRASTAPSWRATAAANRSNTGRCGPRRSTRTCASWPTRRFPPTRWPRSRPP